MQGTVLHNLQIFSQLINPQKNRSLGKLYKEAHIVFSNKTKKLIVLFPRTC